MKKLVYLFLSLLSSCIFAQQPQKINSFMDYTWANVGNPGFSAGKAQYTSLAISPSDNQPYVAYSDMSFYPYKASVMKFDGTNWIYVGPQRFTEAGVEFVCLAFSPSGEPYIAFQDWSNSNFRRTTVMKFNGTDWVYVGSPGFSSARADYISFVISQSGEPYVAY